MKVYGSYPFKVTEQDPFVSALCELREESGLTWLEVAEVTHISPTTYGNWESKKTRRPQGATLVATAAALGVEYIDIRNARKGDIVLVRQERARRTKGTQRGRAALHAGA